LHLAAAQGLHGLHAAAAQGLHGLHFAAAQGLRFAACWSRGTTQADLAAPPLAAQGLHGLQGLLAPAAQGLQGLQAAAAQGLQGLHAAAAQGLHLAAAQGLHLAAAQGLHLAAPHWANAGVGFTASTAATPPTATPVATINGIMVLESRMRFVEIICSVPPGMMKLAS
jgi:hypothetical protein